MDKPRGVGCGRAEIAPQHRPLGPCQGRGSAPQVVHSHDTGFVGKVEHWGQNQCAQEQPHGTLHTFPLKT